MDWQFGRRREMLVVSDKYIFFLCVNVTRLLLNWLSRKCVATWAGKRLNKILLLEDCNASMSNFSSLAWCCHRKSSRAIHSTCRPWRATAQRNKMMTITDTTSNGTIELTWSTLILSYSKKWRCVSSYLALASKHSNIGLWLSSMSRMWTVPMATSSKALIMIGSFKNMATVMNPMRQLKTAYWGSGQ